MKAKIAGIYRATPKFCGDTAATGRLRRVSPGGLEALKAAFPAAKLVMVGTGGIPLDEFLSAPAEHGLDG